MSIDLSARAVITELNASFAWALDLHEWDALREVLAVDVHYVSVGREFHDVEQVISSFMARAGVRITRHGLGNLSLREVLGGKTVLGRSSWHTFASNVWPVDGVPLYMVADFSDVYAVDDLGQWRIAERIITPVFRQDRLAPTPTNGVGHE
jgi:SnoaL-like protein